MDRCKQTHALELVSYHIGSGKVLLFQLTGKNIYVDITIMSVGTPTVGVEFKVPVFSSLVFDYSYGFNFSVF